MQHLLFKICGPPSYHYLKIIVSSFISFIKYLMGLWLWLVSLSFMTAETKWETFQMLQQQQRRRRRWKWEWKIGGERGNVVLSPYTLVVEKKCILFKWNISFVMFSFNLPQFISCRAAMNKFVLRCRECIRFGITKKGNMQYF